MGVTLRHFICLGAVAFIVAYACVPLVKRFAVRLDAIDYPSARRVNRVPIPRMGGLAVFAGICAALLFEVIGEWIFGWAGFFASGKGLRVNHVMLLIGFAVVVGVGARDDVKSMKPLNKMLGQIIGASIIAASGVVLHAIVNPFGTGFIQFDWLAYPITVVYLVCFMNVINLADGLDGLAGGIVAIAAFTMFVIAFTGGRVETAMFSIILLGSVLAFLRFNYSPASIFMGDSGSLLMGCMLGVISLLGVMRSPAFIVLAAPLIIAAIPIADTFVAIVRRLWHHQPIQQADTNHLHHFLLKEGFSTRKSVAIVHFWTLLLAIGALIMSKTHGLVVYFVFAVLVVVSFVILRKLHIFGVVLTHHYNQRSGKDRPGHVVVHKAAGRAAVDRTDIEDVSEGPSSEGGRKNAS